MEKMVIFSFSGLNSSIQSLYNTNMQDIIKHITYDLLR